MNDRGALLLEVLVALVVLGLTGTSALLAVRGAISHIERVGRTERAVADADRLVAAYALLARNDLAERLGTHQIGPYAVDVRWQDLDLFSVQVQGAAGVELGTALYRPRPVAEPERELEPEP